MLFSMAGLVKAKKYDWKDSNLALFGSDVEKNVRFFKRQRSAGVALVLSICSSGQTIGVS